MKTKAVPHQTSLVAAAGEYYVLSRLCLTGHIAAPAPKGVPYCDIIVSDVTGTRMFAIQVKSRCSRGADNGWHMHKKHEEIASDYLYYCFVDFQNVEVALPTTYVVPSHVVADVLAITHKKWLEKPGRGGRPHKDQDMRRFLPDYTVTLGEYGDDFGPGWLEQYREGWHLFA